MLDRFPQTRHKQPDNQHESLTKYIFDSQTIAFSNRNYFKIIQVSKATHNHNYKFD